MYNFTALKTMTIDTPEDKPSVISKVKEKPPKLAECSSSTITHSDSNSDKCSAERSVRPRAYSMHTKPRLRKERAYCYDISSRRSSLPASALIQNFLSVPGLDKNTMDNFDRSDDSSSEEDNLRRARSLKGEKSDSGREPLRRVRSFKTTSKGLINRGDSFKRKKNRSHTGCKVLEDGSDKRDQRNHLTLEDACSPQTIPTVSIDTTGSLDQTPNHFRVLMLGVPGVGKTLLTDQFMTSEFLGNYEYSICKLNFFLNLDMVKRVASMLSSHFAVTSCVLHLTIKHFPLYTGRLFHCYMLDESIYRLRGVDLNIAFILFLDGKSC